MRERRQLIDKTHRLSVRRQCQLLDVPRSSAYIKGATESATNLELMRLMDVCFIQDPTLGVLGMQDELREHGHWYNVKRIRRLLRKMGVEPIYPRKNLSKLGKAEYIHPYLLRGRQITQVNQVWAIDITYIPMRKGFMYLTAIIDVYSRYIVGWTLSNSLEAHVQTQVLRQAIERHGLPQIVNSDQGSQFTSKHWVETLRSLKIQISMDGKGRATDNAHIERWFRTLKQKYIYLNPADNGHTLHRGITEFVARYNKRRHQGIDRRKPCELYHHAA